MQWAIRGRVLEVDGPLVMGILNVTPDSFSDGGRYADRDAAIAHALRMLDEGADIVDIGGESTRPAAGDISVDEELGRVIPVIEQLVRERPEVVVSVDTVKRDVACAAIEAGARIVNDVSALRLDPGMARLCAESGVGVVLMHSRGTVTEMASFAYATYDDVVSDVMRELWTAIEVAEDAGVSGDAIVLDPGIGFSKRSGESIAMLQAIPRLAEWRFPIAVGVSRKRFIGELTGIRDAGDRLHGTLGANVGALALGARIFRVHDVRPHREALDVAWELLRVGGGK
jgi:dihydropteroate synthase